MSVQHLTISSQDRTQMVKESGAVSGIKSCLEAHKVLQLIEDYQGVTSEQLNMARSSVVEASGLGDRAVCSLINEYVGAMRARKETRGNPGCAIIVSEKSRHRIKIPSFRNRLHAAIN